MFLVSKGDELNILQISWTKYVENKTPRFSKKSVFPGVFFPYIQSIFRLTDTQAMALRIFPDSFIFADPTSDQPIWESWFLYTSEVWLVCINAHLVSWKLSWAQLLWFSTLILVSFQNEFPVSSPAHDSTIETVLINKSKSMSLLYSKYSSV